MLVRITRKSHTKGGRTYRAGDTLDLSEREFLAIKDRAEIVETQVVREQRHVVSTVDPKDALRAEIESLGGSYDGRWGEPRLREEIAKLRAA